MMREAEIFAEAIELDEAERAAFVARACGDNSRLRDTVEALLRGHAKAECVFTEPLAERMIADLRAEKPGVVIGRYTLLEKIGEGGCGVVWRAEQREPVRREVALKVIKLGMDTREVIARFEAERQALAMMDHPNIARVFDGGATGSGRPYFVMEYVRGVPITRYCDEAQLSITARLKLFIGVCRAIQHAHQKGIIHRDLKPSNILVVDAGDALAVERLDPKPLASTGKPAAGGQAAPSAIEPTPKVIDFGIAKATQGRLTDATVFTAFEQFIGTPAYMSPEQADRGGLDIDTRSDIYSLGVLLYELLTGQTPLDAKTFAHTGVDKVRQHLRETEPPRPSTRLDTLGREERAKIARRRRIVPAELSGVLRGDLDWIVMRCLEKDRTRRYDTANGLAMDLERHLRHEPVVARPPSRAYLLQKFVRRNRVAFAGIAAVAVVLVLGATLSTWQAIRATRAEKAERRLLARAVEENQLGLQRSSRADFKLGSRLLDEGNAGEGLAYLVRAARSDPKNAVVGPRLVSALVTRNFLLPERAPLQLPAAVRSLTCTADGSEVFVLCEDDAVRVLDGNGHRVLREFPFSNKIRYIVLAQRNRGVFAVCFGDNSLVICDAATGRALTPPILPPQEPLSYLSSKLSADGSWLAGATDGEVWIWDAATGALRATLPHPEMIANQPGANRGRVSAFDFSPDAQRIVTNAAAGYTRIWSVPDGRPLTEPILSGTNMTSVRFSPDGRLIAVGMDNGAQLRDAYSGELFGPFLPHGATVGSALFTPDNRHVITTSGERTVKVWRVSTGQPALPALRHDGPLYGVFGLAVSDDGRTLLTKCSDGFTRVWDLVTGHLLAQPIARPESPPTAYSPDGKRIFVGNRSGLVFALRVDRAHARPLVLPRGSEFLGLGLASAPPARVRRVTAERVEVIDVASGREVTGGFALPQPITRRGQIRPDGRYMAVQTEVGRNEIWEVIEGRVRVIALEDAPKGNAWSQFSAVGDLVSMVEGRSPIIRAWNLRTGRLVAPPLHCDVTIFHFSPGFSPDGKRFAAGGIDGGIARVWDAATGQALFDLKPMDATQVNRVAFSPDGTRIATTNNLYEARLWNGMTGAPISPILLHRARVEAATFSPDGRTFATTSHDGLARVWDARDGTPISETLALPGRVLNVQYSADGSRIATYSADGTARIWDTPTGSPLSDALLHTLPIEFPELVQSANGQFSPVDGRFLCTFSPTHIYLWPVPPDAGNAPVPEWLLRLATICAGKRVTPDGVLVDASDEIAMFDELRREIAALPAEAPFAEWGRWFLADPATRSIAPGFTITPAEADKLAVAMSEKKS